MDQLLPLAAGFVLTTVLGGLLAAFLQQRTWDHQHTVQAEQAAVARADEVCRQTMTLLDKRLYRMLRLYHACRATGTDNVGTSTLNERLKDYDAVLYEWNDQLNSRLALIDTYFGQVARRWLEVEIYGGFQQVGADLERFYVLSRTNAQRAVPEEQVGAGLETLNDRVYRLGLFLTGQLLRRRVGRNASNPASPADSPSDVTARAVPLPPESRGFPVGG